MAQSSAFAWSHRRSQVAGSSTQKTVLAHSMFCIPVVHLSDPAPLACAPPGKPRGYAFIEFEHKNDMKTAYKMADGKKIEGRRVVVDVERGRTVPNWWVSFLSRATVQKCSACWRRVACETVL